METENEGQWLSSGRDMLLKSIATSESEFGVDGYS